MKKLSIITLPILLAGFALVLQGCGTGERMTEGEAIETADGREIVSDIRINPNGTLADHLRMLPGLEVTDTRVQLRGPKSIARAGSEGPLFVINTVPVGEDFSRVQSLIHMENVRAIKLYRGGEAFRRFGTRAAYGAIEITTD